ncbi:hypothetical protein [Actinomadura sp. DC4]|uniref:hypothetical protein n=1 Tax=Actinomadura sp. DC4 TaxID=3055069 RepID=UPI0025B03A80|nr:hypothetical protein [Actinomadura sp. DC4]MDN3358845.1 hypothetical protein [Actinomadura sp. DC4]
MKFEIVEQYQRGTLYGDNPGSDNSMTENQASADPFQDLVIGAARLVSGVQAEARRIDDCVAEAADLAALSAVARAGPTTAARPPASFRAARFGGRPTRRGLS